MKVLVVGGGPAGLSLATLLARTDSARDITVIERNLPREDPGWGITLRTNALSFLDLDQKLAWQTLEGRACWYRGELVVDLAYPPKVGNTAISRTAVLNVLVDSCEEAGVTLLFETDSARLSDSNLAEYDLVVAADGAHSAIRGRYSEAFLPSIVPGKNRYSWLAVERPFDKLSILLQDGVMPLLAWGYKHTPSLSTFIVEAATQTLEKTGIFNQSPAETCQTIAKVFERELEGARVLCRGAVRWQAFPKISCKRLRHKNIALIGDAAHTTHFSQGYGTMFAFDDALALSAALSETTNIDDALDQYEKVQQPKIAALQDTAFASMRWAESVVETLQSNDDQKIRALIAARWPNNEVSPAPMSSFGAPHNGES